MPIEPEDHGDIEMVPDPESASLQGRDADKAADRLRARLKSLEAERQEYLDGWQRAKADLANYKRDEARRFEEFGRFALGDIVTDIVQVLDSFDLALRHDMPKEVEQGIILIRSQLEDALRRRGLEVIHARGGRFDPALHEAIADVESDAPEGTIVEELQRGYRLAGKVIRPARVKVAKARAGPA